MRASYPTPVYRFMHVDNLHVCLQRGGLHAPNYIPEDGQTYKTIHIVDIQNQRRITRVPIGPGGVIHDYVSFYLGYLSPMMFQLKTGRVNGYNEGQEPLVYLVSTVQDVVNSGAGYAFSDGHGLAAYTSWYDDLDDLDKVDWEMVYQRYWSDNLEDMDRQRRKQAEFLVHRFCNWSLIQEIAVFKGQMKSNVERIIGRFPRELHRTVRIRPEWYY